MAYKTLGQSSPAATTATDAYTVPAGKSAVCSSIVVANTTGGAIAYRISVRVAGAAAATMQYLSYDVSIPGNSSDFMRLGVTLAATDVVTVYAAATGLAFNLFGDES